MSDRNFDTWRVGKCDECLRGLHSKCRRKLFDCGCDCWKRKIDALLSKGPAMKSTPMPDAEKPGRPKACAKCGRPERDHTREQIDKCYPEYRPEIENQALRAKIERVEALVRSDAILVNLPARIRAALSDSAPSEGKPQ